MAPSSQASQAGLLTAMQPALTAAWQQLDISNLKASLPQFKTLIAAITHRYGSASGALATKQYLDDRARAGLPKTFTPRMAKLPPLPQIGNTVDWATQPLWSATPDVKLSHEQVAASIERLVQNVGRQTIVQNADSDRKARGWARIPEAGCCSFCAMLATRGAVYKEDTVDFEAHNNCRCHAEPVFNAYEPSAQVREWQALYRTSTAGLSGDAALNAFRVALSQ